MDERLRQLCRDYQKSQDPLVRDQLYNSFLQSGRIPPEATRLLASLGYPDTGQPRLFLSISEGLIEEVGYQITSKSQVDRENLRITFFKQLLESSPSFKKVLLRWVYNYYNQIFHEVLSALNMQISINPVEFADSVLRKEKLEFWDNYLPYEREDGAFDDEASQNENDRRHQNLSDDQTLKVTVETLWVGIIGLIAPLYSFEVCESLFERLDYVALPKNMPSSVSLAIRTLQGALFFLFNYGVTNTAGFSSLDDGELRTDHGFPGVRQILANYTHLTFSLPWVRGTGLLRKEGLSAIGQPLGDATLLSNLLGGGTVAYYHLKHQQELEKRKEEADKWRQEWDETTAKLNSKQPQYSSLRRKQRAKQQAMLAKLALEEDGILWDKQEARWDRPIYKFLQDVLLDELVRDC